MGTDLARKLRVAADCIDGSVIDDSKRVGVFIKGEMDGFPVTLEAIGAGWPWPTTYTLEVEYDEDDEDYEEEEDNSGESSEAANASSDADSDAEDYDDDDEYEDEEYAVISSTINVCPRIGRGLMRFFSHALLFESRGQGISNKKLESKLIFSYDDRDVAERLLLYPGVGDNLLALEEISKFSEVVIKTDKGIYLSQPTSFNSLDLDIMRATFREMAELGATMYDLFS